MQPGERTVLPDLRPCLADLPEEIHTEDLAVTQKAAIAGRGVIQQFLTYLPGKVGGLFAQ
ncbi:hypothetical protein D3C76_1645300 [compost metagenome]